MNPLEKTVFEIDVFLNMKQLDPFPINLQLGYDQPIQNALLPD